MREPMWPWVSPGNLGGHVSFHSMTQQTIYIYIKSFTSDAVAVLLRVVFSPLRNYYTHGYQGSIGPDL